MKNTNIDVSQHINKDEKILWQGSNEKISYTKNATTAIIIRDIFIFLCSIVCCMAATTFILDETFVAICLYLFAGFGIYVICTLRNQKYVYVITDKNVYVFANSRKRRKDARFFSLPVNELDTIRLNINKDTTATITFNQPDITYNGLNYRGIDTRRKILSRNFVVQFWAIKDYETVCRCVSEIMSSTK